MTPSNGAQMLSHMISFSALRHEYQFDKAGNPYILHALKVMYLLRAPDDWELQCIGCGHDLIEDTKTTYAELNVFCTKRVVDGIKALTRLRGQTEEEYQRQVCTNIDAIRVKLCDLRHNSDLRRLKGVTEKDFARMQKYTKFYDMLKRILADWEKYQWEKPTPIV